MKKILFSLVVSTFIFVLTLKISWPNQAPVFIQQADENRLISLYYNGMHEKSIEYLDRLIERKPEKIELMLMKGHILRQLGDAEKAIGTYAEALKNDPANYLANYYYALANYLCGNFNSSLKTLEKFISTKKNPLSKHSRDIYFLKGMAEIENKNFVEAAKTFKSLNEFYPGYSPYLQMMAFALEKNGNLINAKEAYINAYKNDTSNFEILFDAAPLMLKSGDIANAYKYYHKLAAKIGENEDLQEIYQRVVKMYREIKKTETTKPGEEIEPQKAEQLAMTPLKEYDLKIGLNTNQSGEPIALKSIKLKASGPFIIESEKSGKTLFESLDSKSRIYELYFKNSELIIKSDAKTKATPLGGANIILKPVNKNDTIMFKDIKVGAGSPWESSESRYYRGIFKFVTQKKSFFIVNIINIEYYLLSVLPSEMPSGFPEQALIAQAICARSEAYYKKSKTRRHARHGFDLCDDQHCQMYRGVSWEHALCNNAVKKSIGKFITHDKKVCDAIYSDNCGGHTQSSSDISGWGNIKYLSAVADIPSDKNEMSDIINPLFFERYIEDAGESYCRAQGQIKNYEARWIRKIEAKEINECLKHLQIGEILKIIPRKRSISGHVDSLEIIGTRGVKSIKNELSIRRLISYSPLRSSKFIVETAYDKKGKPRSFIFMGAGFGHGVGMCQSGAYGMAMAGKKYDEILRHYFTDSQLSALY